MEEKVTQQENEVVKNDETISQDEEKVVSSQQDTDEMSDEELLDNMKGLKIVTNDGQEKELSAAGFQKLVQASLMATPVGIQARAAAAAAADTMESGLSSTSNPAKVRTLDSSGNSCVTDTSTLASVVGGLNSPWASSIQFGAGSTSKIFKLFVMSPNSGDTGSMSFMFRNSRVAKTELGYFSIMNRSNNSPGLYQFAKRLAGVDNGVKFYYSGGISSDVTVYVSLPDYTQVRIPLLFNDRNVAINPTEVSIDVSTLNNIPIE